MNKHPDCKDECQQAVDYGVWPERSCSPECVYLRRVQCDATNVQEAVTEDRRRELNIKEAHDAAS